MQFHESIKITDYKCFGAHPEGFEEIRRFNVIVGRNNNGKSALLDLIQQVCSSRLGFRSQDTPTNKRARVIFEVPITSGLAKSVFPANTQASGVRMPYDQVAIHYTDKRLTFASWNDSSLDGRETLSVSGDMDFLFRSAGTKQEMEKQFAPKVKHSLQGRRFARLQAERDVLPETASGVLDIGPKGGNVTNLIQSVLNDESRDRRLVTDNLKASINDVLNPDYHVDEIVTKRLDSSEWEIYLGERNHLVPLSASGSGLKTILCVLAMLQLEPEASKRDIRNSVFGFEELENHLHPALLRRLLSYITKRLRESDCLLFLTTHSNVAIDFFASLDDAQIVHVSRDSEGPARCRQLVTHLHHRAILDDLDCRASDLLQANGIVWVEGPSDRTYVNRWIDILSKGSLREGVHYQCVFYGGALLAHLTATEERSAQNVEDLVKVLNVNRNVALVVDSDRGAASDSLSATKIRLQTEIHQMGGYFWTTEGREIENYLGVKPIATAAELEIETPLGQFEDISSYLDALHAGRGSRFERSKAAFAVRASASMDDAALDVLDLRDRVKDLCAAIGRWNGIGTSTYA